MKNIQKYETDAGFIKWMIARGGTIFLTLPRGLFWLIESLRRIVMYGFNGIVDSFIFLIGFYVIYLIIKWKEKQIKKGVSPATNDKAPLLITIIVMILFLMQIFISQ